MKELNEISVEPQWKDNFVWQKDTWIIKKDTWRLTILIQIKKKKFFKKGTF